MAIEASDTGTGYTRKPATYNAVLTEVGRGKPMGELLRRYWHPIGLVADAGATPKPVRVFGEDLILFRDGRGQAGLVEARCCHRGTTLYYGRVEERGIRCCYHGWLFDTQGRCLEQPCEPEGGLKRDRVRQPWYPVQERYGLIFAYMGPPEKKPVLPRYDCLEMLEPGESNRSRRQQHRLRRRHDRALQLASALRKRAGRVPRSHSAWRVQRRAIRGADGHHAESEVGIFSGRRQDDLRPRARRRARPLPGDGGSAADAARRAQSAGRTLRGRRIPGWTLPIDDTHFRIYVAGKVRTKGELGAKRSRMNGKLWAELTPEEHQQFPGDWEAQVGQGPITYIPTSTSRPATRVS